MSQQLPLELLNTFVVFVQSENISAAAVRLRLSQPAVSVQLKRLEELTPFPLFVMQGKRKALTHFGKTLFDAIADRLGDVHRVVDTVTRSYLEPSRMRLRIAARKEIIARVALLLRYEGSIQFLNLSSDESLAALERFEADVAIAQKRPSQGHLVTKKLFSDTAKFAVPKALAPARPTLAVLRSREFLMGTPCLAYKPELPFLAEWCAACGVPEALLRVRRTCDDWFAVGKMVEAGIGFGILPSSMTLDESKVWEVDVPQEDLPSTTFYVVFHSDLKNVPAVQELLRNVTLG